MMGCSCDWERTRFTLDELCSRAVRRTFFNLFKAGKVFRGKRLINWDTQLRTAVADDEIYYEETQGHLWTIKYPIAGSTTGEHPSHRHDAARDHARRYGRGGSSRRFAISASDRQARRPAADRRDRFRSSPTACWWTQLSAPAW